MDSGNHDIQANLYHADPCPEPSLSASIAKILLEKSPQHAWYAHPRLNPDYRAEEAAVFDYGTAAHAMLLEGTQKNLVIVQADDWRTKAARDARDDARATGKTPILERQVEKVSKMVRAAKAAIVATELSSIFKLGKPERTLIWKESGIWCRSRLDMLDEKNAIIMDYKTTTNAEPLYLCRRMLVQMGYDVQAEFYTRGYRALSGKQAAFVFLFQEIDPPYACSLVSLAPSLADLAKRKVDMAIKRWGQCLGGLGWPGYDKRVHHAELDPWQLAAFQERAQK